MCMHNIMYTYTSFIVNLDLIRCSVLSQHVHVHQSWPYDTIILIQCVYHNIIHCVGQINYFIVNWKTCVLLQCGKLKWPEGHIQEIYQCRSKSRMISR